VNNFGRVASMTACLVFLDWWESALHFVHDLTILNLNISTSFGPFSENTKQFFKTTNTSYF
jgi:hypothetical protein